MSLTLPVAALAALLSPLAAAEPTGCTALTREVTESVAASPDKVVKLTAEFCAKNPACACDIVAAALLASKADASLRAEIISAALQAAPDQLEAITACTTVEEPSGKAPAGKEPAGKEPGGKEPAGKAMVQPPPEPDSDLGLDTIDFGLFRAGIGGVYIGSPSSGTGSPTIETVPEETTTPQTPRRVIVRIPGTVSPIASSGGTTSSDGVLTISSSQSPGNSPGTLTTVNLTLNNGSIIELGSQTAISDSINATAAFNLSGTTLNLNGQFSSWQRNTLTTAHQGITIAPGFTVNYLGNSYTSENVGQLNSLLGFTPANQ